MFNIDIKFATYTKKIISCLPYWFNIKKHSTESIGAQFLNVVGLELDDISYLLNYAYEQTRIDKADLDFVDIVYKVILPGTIDSSLIKRVLAGDAELIKTDTLSKFFGIKTHAFDYPESFGHNFYYLDQPRNILYVRSNYNKTNTHPDGTINIQIDKTVSTHSLTLHQVWNFFDEFGLLLGCSRIYGEPNREFKERILDVFKNLAGSNRIGLLNGIVRDLGIRKNILWIDGSVDIIIEEPMIVLNNIKIDNIVCNESEVFITEHNTIMLKGNPTYKNITRNVSYVTGVEIHNFNNKDDFKLSNELINLDKTATALLLYYVEKINSEAPVKWDMFKWNESYWDSSDVEAGGFAYIPNLFDGNINGFTKFNKNMLHKK